MRQMDAERLGIMNKADKGTQTLLYPGPTSNFAKHLNEAHSFGPINSIMQVLRYKTKGAHLNTI
jgi:hypothetical protein